VKGRQPGIVGRWRHVGGSTGPAPLGKCGISIALAAAWKWADKRTQAATRAAAEKPNKTDRKIYLHGKYISQARVKFAS
jgi:hypothetical protein